MTEVILTLDAGAILRLAQTPAVVAEFPFLKMFGPRKAGCCGKANSGPDPGKAIASLVGLPPERKAVFKRLVGATRVVVVTVRAARQVKVEF